VATKFERTNTGKWRASRNKVPLWSRLITDRVAEFYTRAIADHATGKLADLGCGAVPLYGIYRDKISEAFCVDWPGSAHVVDHVDLFTDLNEPFDLEAESYDTIIASDVVEHLHTPQALFTSAARALKPGGKLIVGVPFLYWLHEAPHDYHRYTRYALERLTAQAGLSVLELASYGGGPEVLADLATKTVAGHPIVTRIVFGFSKMILALPIVKKLTVATKEQIPMGYLLVAAKEQSLR